MVFGRSTSEIKEFFALAMSLGADRATWTRSQFVRVPDGRRENGARQFCLYLNPEEAVTDA
jgi:hypothetical protein